MRLQPFHQIRSCPTAGAVVSAVRAMVFLASPPCADLNGVDCLIDRYPGAAVLLLAVQTNPVVRTNQFLSDSTSGGL